MAKPYVMVGSSMGSTASRRMSFLYFAPKFVYWMLYARKNASTVEMTALVREMMMLLPKASANPFPVSTAV